MCIAKTNKRTWDDEELRTLRLVRGRRRLRWPVFARIRQHRGDTDVSDSSSDSEYGDRNADTVDESGRGRERQPSLPPSRPPSPTSRPLSPPSRPPPSTGPARSLPPLTPPDGPWGQGPNPFWSCVCPYCTPPPATVGQGSRGSDDDVEPMVADEPSGSRAAVSGSDGPSGHKRPRSPSFQFPQAKKTQR